MISRSRACSNFFIVNECYSVLKLLTGLALAAFIAWNDTVNNAIATDKKQAAANTHQCMVTRYV